MWAFFRSSKTLFTVEVEHETRVDDETPASAPTNEICFISMKAYARNLGLLTLFVCVFVCIRGAAQSPAPQSMPGLRLSIDQLKAQYTHYSVGKRLKPKQWPNGARVAVALSFDVDNATVPLSRGQLGSED